MQRPRVCGFLGQLSVTFLSVSNFVMLGELLVGGPVFYRRTGNSVSTPGA